MTQRDLDEAVARLRAASLRNDQAAADLGPDLGPPRGRPEAAGQGPLDPDIVDAHAQVVTGHEAPPSGQPLRPRTDWDQPRPEPVPVAPRPSQAPAPSISPEARARAEAQLRAAIQGQRTAQGAANPPPRPPRPAPQPPAAPMRQDRLVPPAPVLDTADRRNRIGDPGTIDVGVATDDAVEDEPLGRKAGFFARRPRAGRAEPAVRDTAPSTPKQQRWQRRRRRHVWEEILGWVLVPVILFGLYWAVVGGLAVFGLTLEEAMAGLREAWDALS